MLLAAFLWSGFPGRCCDCPWGRAHCASHAARPHCGIVVRQHSATIPSPRRVTDTARARDRATARAARASNRTIARVTREVAAVISHVHGFFKRERTAGRATGVARPVECSARATGGGQRTVERVTAHGCAGALPFRREAVTRRSQRRPPPAERPRVPASVYAQYEHRYIPNWDTTLAYLRTQSVVMSWTDSPSAYTRSRMTLFPALQEISFSFSRGPNHYDVAREKPSVVAQRESFLASIKQYRDGGRTIYYTDETWANRNMSVYRSWTAGTLRTRMSVPSGKSGRLIAAHVGLLETGLVADAALVFIGQKGSGDYHTELCSEVWLWWLEETVFPKISRNLLVVDGPPYHLLLTPATSPARSRLRKAELAAWVESRDVVPQDGKYVCQQSRKRAEMKAVAEENMPAPRFQMQQLAARFGVSVLISPVAHPDLNPTEMAWGTVKMALKRGNMRFTLSAIKGLVANEGDRITPAVWAKYEYHAIKRENSYRGLDASRDDVEGDL